MAKKKPKAKSNKKPRVRIWNRKPQWMYDFKSGRYEMLEYKAGVKYTTSLTGIQFYKMNDECINTPERTQWLSKAKKSPTRSTSK